MTTASTATTSIDVTAVADRAGTTARTVRPAPTVTIVMPARNEARNLEQILPELPPVHQLVLVDGHSTDDTIAVARRLVPDVHVVQQTRTGKGNALLCGFAAATGDIVVMFDADGSADPGEIPAFVAALADGADFAKGSRYCDGGGSHDITLYRSLGNKFLNLVTNTLLGTRYTDLCYGYNAFWRTALRHLELPSHVVVAGAEGPVWGDGFEIETVLNCRVASAGLSVAEVPSVERNRLFGESNLNAIRDGLRVLRTILIESRSARRRRKAERAGGIAGRPVGVLADEPAAATHRGPEECGRALYLVDADASRRLLEPTTSIVRPMASSAEPRWPGALWIGAVDSVATDVVEFVALPGAGEYTDARLLVREDGVVRGFVQVPILNGCVSSHDIATRAAALPAPQPRPAAGELPSMSVVIGTRDRADQLANALDSVLALDYPAFEVVVVDNASATDETRRAVEAAAASGSVTVRYVTEPRPGLANARNTGVRAASGDVVAFTDDDVVVDPLWLRRLADGFARGDDVTCVTGMVPSGELHAPTQAYFEQRVSWASSCDSRVFRMSDPPAENPLFPFQVGLFGTGANFAMRRAAVHAHGGFDEALGVGSPGMGGEDIDMFVRVVTSGQALAFEPSAVVWHRHRSDTAALGHQAISYGTGLGAWLTKVALDRRLCLLALRRAVAGVRRARALAAPAPAASDVTIEASVRQALQLVGRAERRAFLAGPVTYLRSRRQGLRARPLSALPDRA